MIAPLQGLRILDFTSVMMGPYATQILADYGADVIKVEAPSGDTTRHLPPMRHKNMGGLFLQMNRNKRSVVLDLKDPLAVEAFLDLAGTVDAVITSVRAAALDRLGVGYEAVSARFPKTIWISLVGFGSTGRYGGQPAYDDLIQGLTAVPSMLVEAGSEKLHYVPAAFNDRAVGLHAVIALLAAVRLRENAGVGQFVEVPMHELMTQFTLADHMCGQNFVPPLGPPGYRRSLSKQRHPYATSDGFICTIIYNDKHWRSFFELTGQTGRFETDPRVQSMTARTEHSSELLGELAAIMKTRTTAEWLAAFGKADIPAAPLHDIQTAIDDPHLADVGFFETCEHPTEGTIKQMSVCTTWSTADVGALRPAPNLGEHTEEVLAEAGIPESVIAKLVIP